MVHDNISGQGSGIVVDTVEPKNKNVKWIDTSKGGVLKYHNGTSWVPVASVWT